MTCTVHYATYNTSLIVRMALFEFGMPFSTKLADQPNQRRSSAADVSMNPDGLITVIETPNSTNCKTATILLWLVV